MKLSSPLTLLCALATVEAYSCGPPRGNSAFRSRMREMSPTQQSELRRQQSDVVDRAFESLANEMQNKRYDPNTVPKQKEMVDKAVEFFTGMGTIDKDDAENLRDFTNKGFEIAQDIASGSYSPAYNIQENEVELEISLDLPGVAKADIEIEIESGFLKVNGSRDMSKTDVPKLVPFARSFPIDEKTSDTNSISASLDSGVLVLRIPKKQILKPAGKRIDII